MAETWVTPKTWSYKEAPGSDSLNEQIRDNLKYVKESLPAGIMMGYGGATAPSQWLLCDGTAVSRATYSALFSAIGVAYGVGNGSTTFNLPDYRGRVMVGLSSTDSDFDTLGEKYGDKTKTIAAGNLPELAVTITDPGHDHTASYTTDGNNDPLGGNYNIVTDYRDNKGAGNKITIAENSTGISATANTGGANTPLSVVQPGQVSNFIIKY